MTSAAKNRQFFLASRPKAMIEEGTFGYREADVPSPGPGEFLVRSLYLSLDPAMRGWMRSTATYIDPVNIGDVMRGVTKRASMTGFVVLDYVDRFLQGAMELAQWVMQGKLKYREHIVDGLENAPRALGMLFDGSNQGKLIVKIADA
jgi:NADPH-dependent curcumin reductase CurA